MSLEIPLILSFTVLGLWILMEVFFRKILQGSFKVFSVTFSVAQFILSIFIFASVVQGSQAPATLLRWTPGWLSVGLENPFLLDFEMGSFFAFIWMFYSFLVLVTFLFRLIYLSSDENHELFEVAAPLASLASLTLISGNNFLLFFIGMTVFTFINLLAFGMQANKENESRSLRFSVFHFLSDLIILVGLMEIYKKYGSFEFEKAFASGEICVGLIMMLFGSLLKLTSIPLLNYPKSISSSKNHFEIISLSFFLICSIVVANKFITRLSVNDFMATDLRYLILLPLITILAQSVVVFSCEEKPQYAGVFLNYFVGYILISAFFGSKASTKVFSVYSLPVISCLLFCKEYLRAGERLLQIILFFIAMCISALPLTGWGWAKYSFFSILIERSAGNGIYYVVIGALVLSDFVLTTFLYYLSNESRFASAKKTDVFFVAIFTMLMLLNVSMVLGGRVFGGYENEAILSATYNMNWLEKYIFGFSDQVTAQAALFAQDENALFYTKILLLFIFISTMVLSNLFLFKEEAGFMGFRRFQTRLGKRINEFFLRIENFFVGVVFQKALNMVETLFSWFDLFWSKSLISLPSFVVFGFFAKVISPFESVLFEKFISSGIPRAVQKLGIQLRRMHVGKVQAYFISGVLVIIFLFGVVIVKN